MPPSNTAVSSLVASLQPPPLRALADQFDFVCWTLRRLGVVDTHVEDLAQDVFLIMCRRWADYRPDRPLRPWLAGIANHVARRHLTRVWRESPAGEIELLDEAPLADERLASERARALAVRCLASLAPPDRELLALHDIDEVPVRQVAEQLSVPLFTVYTRLRRARLRFARRLRELQGHSQIGNKASQRGALPVVALLPEIGGYRPGRTSWPRVVGPRWNTAPLCGGVAAALALITVLVQRPLDSRAGTETGLERRPAPTANVAEAAFRTARHASIKWKTRVPALIAERPASHTASLAASLVESLAGYWRFDEAPGAAMSVDMSPGGRDCLLRAADPGRAWVPGALGGAVDVGEGWIECPRPRSPAQPGDELAVAAWVRLQALPSRSIAFVSRQLGDGREDHFFLGAVGRRLVVRSSLWGVTVNGPALPTGRWVHVAFTHGPAGTQLYLDGWRVASHPRNYQRRSVMIGTPVAIGAGINGPGDSARGQQLNGAVDEVLLHERALTPAEVALLAAGEQPPSAR